MCGCIRLSIDEIPRSNADNFLHVPEKDECYVSTVCVSERARGKGVGTRFLEEAETFARKYQKTRLTLEVLNGNPAERLYRRFGFEPVEETGAAWSRRELPLVRVHRQKRAREIWTGEDGKDTHV